MTFSAFTRYCALIAVLILAWAVGYVAAQSQPTSPAPQACEQQLEAATRTILQLRKANAQEAFRAATLEESLMDAQKKMAAESAKGKAAQSEEKKK